MSGPYKAGRMPDIGTLERFRHAETRCVQEWLRPGVRVLEIGAGSGYQARIFHEHGCVVTAIDVQVASSSRLFWPVQPFDGVNLPFRTGSFDLVFTSNVLEHVKDRPGLLREVGRVVRPGGYAIHIVPSATWRLWTSLARVVKAGRPRINRTQHREEVSRVIDQAPPRRSTIDIAFGRPHGEYVNTAVELWQYRRSEWARALMSSNFKLVVAFGNRLFYTGYTLLPQLPLKARALASTILGSSCHVFVLQRTDGMPAELLRATEQVNR